MATGNEFLYRKKKSSKSDPYTFHFLRRRLMDLDNMSYRDNEGNIRELSDYPSWSKVKVIGKYKDYEKGGWYSTLDLLQLGNEYFANCECSHTMNSVYCEQNNLK